MHSSMMLVRCVSSVMIARMNTNKKQNICPIPNIASTVEMSLDSLVSSAEFISPVVMFTWNKHPDTVMLKYTGEDTVRS